MPNATYVWELLSFMAEIISLLELCLPYAGLNPPRCIPRGLGPRGPPAIALRQQQPAGLSKPHPLLGGRRSSPLSQALQRQLAASQDQ